MGIIVKEYNVIGNHRSNTVRVLYDAGSGASFVRRDIAEPLGNIDASPVPIRFMMANGLETFTVEQVINLAVDVDGTPLVYMFYIAEDLAEELIIGADMMQKFKITLDMDNEAISIDPRALYLRA
jgi:hypothetical protein